jgi:hypothetical protein
MSSIEKGLGVGKILMNEANHHRTQAKDDSDDVLHFSV